jgi:hypothetical protein
MWHVNDGRPDPSIDPGKASDTVHTFFTAKEYRNQHAGQQQKPEDYYDDIFPFHSALLKIIEEHIYIISYTQLTV